MTSNWQEFDQSMQDADALPLEPPDEGTVFIERLEDGTVQLKVRSPGAQSYSFVNMTWSEWTDLRSLDPAPNEPTIAF